MIRPLIRVLLLLLAVAAAPAAAVDVVIVSKDGPGEGLNDTTPCAPYCDNTGTTMGEQRYNALRYAADFIGARLVSMVPIRVAVDFRSNMRCRPDSAVLASAGTIAMVVNFDGAPKRDTFYPTALANALANTRLVSKNSDGTRANDIDALFNAKLDSSATCLGGIDWYYGLDANVPEGEVSFVSTAIHELVHGLGFQSFVNLDRSSGTVGEFYSGQPDIFSSYIRDLRMRNQPRWPDMTAAERAESATHSSYLVWDGNSTNSAASVLSRGTRQGRVQLYAPATLTPGSSVSHWAKLAQPDQLMEPEVTDEPIFNLGLAACVLQDIGWTLSGVATGCSASPGPEDPGTGFGGGRGDEPKAAPGDMANQTAGGGCSVNPNAGFDPALLLFVVLAGGILAWRRCRWQAS